MFVPFKRDKRTQSTDVGNQITVLYKAVAKLDSGTLGAKPWAAVRRGPGLNLGSGSLTGNQTS